MSSSPDHGACIVSIGFQQVQRAALDFEVWGDTGSFALVPVNTAKCKIKKM
jgi:hypothetical protein